MERPDLLLELAERHGARDTTVRGTAIAELETMEPTSSQYNPDIEIREKSWAYRFAKRFWFNDYGMYGRHFKPDNWQDTRGSTANTEEPEKSLVGASSKTEL